MSAQDGNLSFAASISTDDFDAGINHIEEKVMGVASDIESESTRIQSLINSAIPEVDISFLTNAVPTLNGIGEAYAECYRIIRENETAVNDLSAEYNRLTEQCNKYANVPSKRDEYVALRAQRDAIKENIAVRKEVIKQANEQIGALQKEEKSLVAAAKAAEKSAASMKKNGAESQSLKARIKELEAEAAALVYQYQQEGRELDQSKGRYREIIEELGRLKDIRGDIQTAGSVFANDENQFAGVISGLSGIAGAASAAQGAIGLFGGENQKLQEIMMKVQSLMAITIGLQQLQQTLNKDSAFSLVTLNSLKKIWNKLTGQNTSAIKDENDAISDNIDNTNEDIVATEKHQAVESSDAAATTANSKATELNSTDKTGNAVATQEATAATNTHTAAMTTSTAATGALSAAMRVLKMALISTGIGALIVLVGELVSWIVDLCTAEDEAVKHTQDLNKINEEAAKTYIQEKVALDDNIKMCKTFTGTKEQEKIKVDELNSKYGEALGYYDSLEQWEGVLRDRGPAYCKMLQMKAERQGILNKYVEAYVQLLEVQHKAENGDFDHGGWYTLGITWSTAESHLKDAQRELDSWESELKKADDKLDAYKAQYGFDEVHIDPKAKTISGSGGKKSKTQPVFDADNAAREQRKVINNYEKQVSKFMSDANKQLTQDMINGLTDGLSKEITTIRYNGYERIRAWRESLTELATQRKQMLHDAFMTQQGATESAWENSTNGKKSINDYITEILGVSIEDLENALEEQLTDVGKTAQKMLLSINAQTDRLIDEANKKHYTNFVNTYGTTAEKTKLLISDWTRALNSIPAEITGDAQDKIIDNINEIFANKIDELDLSDLKKSLNWEDVFGDLDRVSTKTLQSLRNKLQDYIKAEKNLSPDAVKSVVEAIEKIDEKLTERNPFSALKTSFTELHVTSIALKHAQEEYNRAVESGTDEEKKNAEATLNAARNAKQKALVDATNALQSATGRMKEYIGIATALSDMLESFGVDIPPELSGFIEGISGALDGLESIDLTKPTSIITGFFKTVTGIGKAIGALFNHDARHEKNIEKLQQQIDALERSYDKLNDAIDKAYSSDASNLINQQNELLQQQKVLIQNQIKEEEAKKNSDDDRIREWKQQIEDIDALIAENKEAAIDAIFGEDLKSAIENFADAYAEAWASGEDRAKSAKDTVRAMMQQMVRESIKAAIQSSGQMELIRQKLAEFYNDGILTEWEQNYVMNMAEELQKELDEQFGWAESLLNDQDSREASQKGIATASQDSVDENNARLTTIQGHTFTLVQGVAELNSTASAMLDRLSGIERNTDETNTKMTQVKDDMRKVKNAIEDIQTHGIVLKR